MPMAKENKPEKEVRGIPFFPLIILLIFLLFVAVAYFLVWPAYGGFVDKKNNLESQRETLKNQKEYFNNLQKLVAEYDSIKTADRAKIEAVLPQEIDEPGLFTLFEILAEKNNMGVLAIDISEKEASPDLQNLGIKEVHVALNFVGRGATDPTGYTDLKNLLTDLENNLRLMDVISINYTPESLSYILNIKTYRLVK